MPAAPPCWFTSPPQAQPCRGARLPSRHRAGGGAAQPRWHCCAASAAAQCPPARGSLRPGRRLHALPGGGGVYTSDVVALSNLCVDVVQPVPELPHLADAAQKAAFHAALLASAPPEAQWEVGGNTNFAIAASRLGLDCVCLGHTGDDPFGAFMVDILRQEGVTVQQLLPAEAGDSDAGGRPPTLLCFVLVDPSNGHAFCSRFDFDARPLLTCSSQLPQAWVDTLAGTRGVFVNGFVFDDLQPSTVMAAVAAAQRGDAVLAFDAGPRAGKLMRDVNPGCAEACAQLLATSDVLLLTQDEAHTLTGVADADAAARVLLGRSRAADPWVIIKQGSKGAIALTRGTASPPRVALPAMAVTPDELQDTVGCGDSFAAAVLLGRTRGHDLAATLALANAVGAATATGRGAGRNVARLRHVRSLLDAAAGDSAADGAVRLAARRALELVAAVSA